MDIKTVYGFIILGLGLAIELTSTQLGLDGAIDEIIKGMMALGLFLIAGKELFNKKIKTE